MAEQLARRPAVAVRTEPSTSNRAVRIGIADRTPATPAAARTASGATGVIWLRPVTW